MGFPLRLKEEKDLMDIGEAKKRIGEEVDLLQKEMNDTATAIFQDPEVGWETPRAVARLGSFLKKYGFTVEGNVAGLTSAFQAYSPQRVDQHPAVCFLAEYDALPEIGHACGHNLSGPIAVGAAVALTRIMDQWNIPGSVHVMGCPCEEGGGGKVVMVEKGAFDSLDYSIHWHGANNPSNRIVVGCPNNAAVRLTVRFRGKSSHASSKPHKGISALEAALLTMTAVNALQRYLTPERFDRVHGVIVSGGEAANIVPSYSEIEFSVRSKHRVFLEDLVQRVSNCARAGALATGAEVEIERGLTYYERIVLQSFRRTALDNLPLLDLPVEERDPHISGSADSSNVSHKIPHLTIRLPITEDADLQVHTAEYAKATDTDMAREAMNKGAKWMGMIGLDLLTDQNLRDTIEAEFAEKKRAAEEPGE